MGLECVASFITHTHTRAYIVSTCIVTVIPKTVIVNINYREISQFSISILKPQQKLT